MIVLKDEELKKMINRANLPELNYRLEMFEDERECDDDAEGMSDREYVLREVEWIIEDFEDDGHACGEDLIESRRLLARTNYGKRIPLGWDFRPLAGYRREDIQRAKNTVNEYNRTKRFAERLRKVL